mgnify:CR=1 FL=1
MANTNIEITSALQAIELLKQYNSAKDQAEKDDLLKQLSDVDRFAYLMITRHNHDPLDLAVKMEKAIKLDQYRPKNMPIVKLAVSKDLDNINGEFDTFDKEMSQMVKNNESPDKIRDKFKEATANIHMLAKQFAIDWIIRLNNHKELVDAARKATKDKVIDVYNELFNALTKDFCDEYGCVIDAKLVKDWETSDIKPKDSTINGFQKSYFTFSLPKNLSASEYKKKQDEILDNLYDHPESHKGSHIRINFSGMANTTEPKYLFYAVVSLFAHEMQHALDFQNPRQGGVRSKF